MTTTTDSHLLRGYAPITEAGWQQIDQEARQRLEPQLGARRIVDWAGPYGWEHSATNLGRSAPLKGPPGADEGAAPSRGRRVLPLAEIRVPFTVSREEIADADRGADDLDLDDLTRAARQLAVAENATVFHGWPGAGFAGIAEATSHEPLSLGADPAGYPAVVARAVETLRGAGVTGPYALAVGPAGYTRIVETTEHGGYLLAEHLRRILGGRLVRAPGVEGAVVASTRGCDFALEVGQDVAVGYHHHDDAWLSLYLEESLSFRVLEPDAAIALR